MLGLLLFTLKKLVSIISDLYFDLELYENGTYSMFPLDQP